MDIPPFQVRLYLPAPFGNRMSNFKHLVLFLSALMLLQSCSEFNRAMKATGPESLDLKLQTAEKFYFTESYEKALPILEELLVLTRGTSLSERVSYMHAKTFYGYDDYVLAGYYLANFVKTFPTSRYAEECAFLAAYCYYRNSPQHTLDQTDTEVAMEQLQLFMIRFPETELRDSCNALIDELRDKMEEKDWDGAKQYMHLRRYKAATEAMRAFLGKWPASALREEAMFELFNAQYQLGINSIESKKTERLKAAMAAYRNFADSYTEGPLWNRAQAMRVILEKELGIEPEQESNSDG